MKKFTLCFLAALTLLTVSAYASGEPGKAASAAVDAYTSASLTKTLLEGDAFDEAAALLAAHGSDLATLADTRAPGYTAPENSTMAAILTVNPDGCAGLSTITEWKYVPNENGDDQVILELTYGQNAVNLGEEDARGTLMVKIDGTSYLVHLAVTDYDEQPYDQAEYEAGAFNPYYSGAENDFSSFTITCQVLSIETSQLLMFN